MKKICLLLLVMLLCGCLKTTVTDGSLPDSGPYGKNRNMAKYGKFNCQVLDNIKYVIENGNGFLTNEGDLYQIGNFSDGTNCRKMVHDNKFIKIIDYYEVDEDDNFYYLRDFELTKYEYSSMYDPIIKDKAIIKALISTDNLLNKIYMLKDDGNIYVGYFGSKMDSKGNYTNQVYDVELYKSYEGERILDFSLYGYNNVGWIKTDKNYYISSLLNEDCEKYDDIKCENDLIKDEHLSSLYKDIAYVYGCSAMYKSCNYVLKDGFIYESHIGG